MVRRQVVVFDYAELGASVPGGELPFELRYQMDYSGFGEPVDIQLPPADQIVDESELRRSASSEFEPVGDALEVPGTQPR
jgi:hypothetical protein